MSEETPVGHVKQDDIDVYVGRDNNGEGMFANDIGERGWLGNPFPLGAGFTREESVEKFKDVFLERLNDDAEFAAAVADLSGKTLGCWCRSVEEETPICHGDIIAHYADIMAGVRHPAVETQTTDPGIYLVNSTGDMHALHTESGDGDTQLLREYLDENDVLEGDNA
jgi:hypothetical protein